MSSRKGARKEARKDKPAKDGQPVRRGKRRSIRYEAVEEWPEDRLVARDEGKPPEIALRKLLAAEAMERLDFQIRFFARQGQAEVLVVHGKGQNSPGGISVLGPLVRQWCDDSSHLVESWHEAPQKWGGAGAIVVVLKKGSS